ncbi:hypothetical protein HPY24_00005, partial [Methylobacterium sp. IIF1SW-B5]|nr:hypothetical protein [Methylobacterium ajmalii]
ALARAGRWRDPRAFHAALGEVARRDPARAALWRADPGTGPRLAALDAALFGDGRDTVPDLAGLARALARLHPPDAVPDALAPLDGPVRHAG